MSWRTLVSLALRVLAGAVERKESIQWEADPSADSDQTDSFRIFQHETSHTLSCYLSEDIPDLKEAAKGLLRLGLGDFVCLSDGRCAWRLEDKVVLRELQEQDSIGSRSTRLELPDDLDPELRGYAIEEALRRSAERNLFDANDFLGPYLRVYLPSLRLHVDETEQIDVGVRAKIFENGIVILSLVVNDRAELDLETFISRRVNLGQLPLSAIEAKTQLALALMTAHSANGGIRVWHRVRILRIRKALKKQLEEGNQSEYFTFVGTGTSSLHGFSRELVQALAYGSGTPRSGFPYLLCGEPEDPRWTGFWSASPHVHLLHFSGQQLSANLNEKLHGHALQRILSRTPPSTGSLVGVPSPENLRKFDDVGIYVNEAVSLWMYAGISEPPSVEGSQEHPLAIPSIQHEARSEVVEYGPILYRSFIHELEDRNLSWDRVLSMWERTTRFELVLADAGRYGEVRRGIEAGLAVRGMKKLRAIAERALTLRRSAAGVEESRRLTAIALILTFTVGLLGLPDLINYFGLDLLFAFRSGLPRSATFLLWNFGVWLLGLALLILIALWLVQRMRWVRWNSKYYRH